MLYEVITRLVEKGLFAPLETADGGIYRIGMALQVIDDLTDFYDDLRDHRHNYLLSAIFHEGTASERQHLAPLLAERPSAGTPVAELFPDAVATVMHRAIRNNFV